jgi:Ni,Fe-hydrogenase III small subunit
VKWFNKFRTRSISVFIVQAGGCRDCNFQFSMALCGNGEIRGITVTDNPKHADCMLICGCINEKSRKKILEVYEKIPSPKAVIAVGACTCSGGLFRKENNGLYTAEEVLPVNSWIRGCTPGANEMLEAVVRALENAGEADYHWGKGRNAV